VLAAAGAGLGKAVMYLSQHQKLAKALGVGIMGTFVASVGTLVTTSWLAGNNIWRLNRRLALLGLEAGGAGTAGEAGAAGAVARGGIIGRILGAGSSVFGTMGSAVAAVMERAGILRILASIASKAVPIVGWIASAQFNRELDKLFNSPLSGSRTTGNLGTHPKVSRFSFAH
jgi:hypothetical protein